MLQKLHKNAKTNYLIRREIQNSTAPISDLARKFNISWLTVKKWKSRSEVSDKSSRPDMVRTSLSQAEEDMILFERKEYKKSIDDIYLTLEDMIPKLYPVKVFRCLSRYGLSVLPDELLKAERQVKKFRKYAIGYLHIDVLYAPKINSKRWYIFTCIDRVSKIAFLWVTDHKTKEMGAEFLEKVLKYYPYKIHYILTDNGLEFCYKALARKTKKIHPFVQICKREKIQHRTIKFRHPWTNGMVERFNGKVKKNVIRRYLFADEVDLVLKLITYLNKYNFEVKLKQLGYKTPNEYLKETKGLYIQRIVT
jgi:transposase-like protein